MGPALTAPVLFRFGFENSRVCLLRACHAVSSKSECIGDYRYDAPLYDNNVLTRGTLNHRTLIFKDDGAMGKTITFVSCQDTAFHYVADDYFLDFDVYATVLGGKLRNVMGTCGNPEANWKYSVPHDPLRRATGYFAGHSLRPLLSRI
ncbi:hypothetical protein V1506DRAFT_572643 [Lipomyces tetrasporus]